MISNTQTGLFVTLKKMQRDQPEAMDSKRRRNRHPVIQLLDFMLDVVVAALEAAIRVREQSVARGSCWIPVKQQKI